MEGTDQAAKDLEAIKDSLKMIESMLGLAQERDDRKPVPVQTLRRLQTMPAYVHRVCALVDQALEHELVLEFETSTAGYVAATFRDGTRLQRISIGELVDAIEEYAEVTKEEEV